MTRHECRPKKMGRVPANAKSQRRRCFSRRSGDVISDENAKPYRPSLVCRQGCREVLAGASYSSTAV